jgi:hypothetical protein
MFSWFKRKQSPLDSILIPTFQWPVSKTGPNMKQWMNEEQTLALSLYYLDTPPDLPTTTDLTVLRSFFRARLAQQNNGLITADIIALKGHTAVRTMFKLPQEPSGMTYLASFTVLFKNCSYVVKIQAAETGFTGLREAMVANTIMAEKSLNNNEMLPKGWWRDPYDASTTSGVLMNMAEAEEYDGTFPEHPLRQARKLQEQTAREIVLKDNLKNLPKFTR